MFLYECLDPCKFVSESLFFQAQSGWFLHGTYGTFRTHGTSGHWTMGTEEPEIYVP